MQYALSDETLKELNTLIILKEKLPHIVLDLSGFMEDRDEEKLKDLIEEIVKFAKRDHSLRSLYISPSGSYAIELKLLLKTEPIFKKYIDDEKYEEVVSKIKEKNKVIKLINAQIDFLKSLSKEFLKTKFKMPTELYDRFEPEIAESLHECMVLSELEGRTLKGKIKRRYLETKEYGIAYLDNIQKEIVGDEKVYMLCQFFPLGDI